MARKPSIILTPADKKSAAKDLRAELTEAKRALKLAEAAVKTATKAVGVIGKDVAALEARIEAMK